MPLWEQESGEHRENTTLNSCNIYVPTGLDVVRLSIKLPPELELLWSIDQSWLGAELSLFRELIVSGYPFGFSATKNSVTPIFLKRSVASLGPDYVYDTYLDSGCSQSMSGGPIWSMGLKFAGIYRGIIYPDTELAAKENRKNDRHGALGIMTEHKAFLTAFR